MHLIKRHFCLIVMIGHFMASSIPAFAADQTAVTGGPLDNYCLRVTNQIRQTCATKFAWDKVVSVSIALDENGRVVETDKDAKPEEIQAAYVLKTVPGLLKPPPDKKKPFWLIIETSRKAELITVAVRDINYGPLMSNLQRRIKRQWYPIKGHQTVRVEVNFKLMKNGNIKDLIVTTSGGSKEIDQAALFAVNQAQPFDRLPDGSPPIVDIEFKFDYNVLNGGGGGVGGGSGSDSDSRGGFAGAGGMAGKAPDIKYTPKAGAALCLINGNTAMSAKNYSLAVQYFQKAIDLEADNLEAKKALSDAYNALALDDLKGNPTRAMETFKKAKLAWPENPKTPDTLEQAQKLFEQSHVPVK